MPPFGTAVAIYCALRDLPLLFSDVIAEGFDVSGNTVIDLDGLATGVGQDVRDDVCNALWRAVRGRASGLTAWTDEHLECSRPTLPSIGDVTESGTS